MHALVLRAEAREDVREIVHWYEAERTGLGVEFAQALEETLRGVCANPLAERRVSRTVRRVLLRRFPYVACYAIQETTVVVHAALHSQRRPGLWRRRV